VDSLCTQQVVQGVQSIVDVWKGAHVYIRCIVWCPSPTSFAPDGQYGNWSINSSGTQTAKRTVTNSYWQPLNGS
jgi:hypothetical protein